MTSRPDVQATVLAVPTGGISAILTGCLTLNGKLKRLAHAYVFEDKEPCVSLASVSRLTLSELAQVNDLLRRFEAELERLNDSYGPASRGT